MEARHTLHELTADLVDLEELFEALAVDPDTGVVAASAELLEILDEARGSFDAKIEACGLRYRALVAYAGMQAAEAARQKKRSEATLAEAERLLETIRACLAHRLKNPTSEQLAELDVKQRQVKGPRCTVTLSPGSEVLVVKDKALVPPEYRKAPDPPPPEEEWPLDIAGMKALVKDGAQIAGVALERKPPTAGVR